MVASAKHKDILEPHGYGRRRHHHHTPRHVYLATFDDIITRTTIWKWESARESNWRQILIN